MTTLEYLAGHATPACVNQPRGAASGSARLIGVDAR